MERGLIKATNSGENFEGWVVGVYGEWSDTLAKLPEKLADGTSKGVLEGGFGPTVGVADGDCRSGGRLPRRWVGRQPSFDPARAAVHSAQRSEVRGRDS